MCKIMTMGSLFDGSGGFPLAAAICGITPVWASEIEPYPIAVSKSHFPQMKHLGDVSKVSGADIQPVDIITFGSPCQDMSIAGKRAGMQHAAKGDDETTRSGLFYEAIRIIKEMRESTDGKYPRYAVWENVPGAFSSNKGEDFRCVLQELAQIAGKEVSIPQPPKGKWHSAGEIVGDGFSLAWRVLDAQYWGVPQRRKRIYLVADFRGQRAGEILFERQGLSGNPEQGEAQGQGAAGHAAGSLGGSDKVKCLNPQESQTNPICFKERAGRPGGGKGILINKDNGTFTLSTFNDRALCVAAFMGGQGEKAGGIGYSERIVPTIKSVMSGGNAVPDVVYALQGNGIDRAETAGCNGKGWREDVCYTLNTIDRPAVVYDTTQITSPLNYSNPLLGDPCHPHAAQQHPPLLVYDARGNGDGHTVPTLTGDHQNRVTDYTSVMVMEGDGNGNAAIDTDVSPTLKTIHPNTLCVPCKTPCRYIVRRLTPLECCRLQGFPDGWGDIPTLETMADEDAAFWEDVRSTHAEIMGKKYAKAKTKVALINWYNKLHTDSAEYKMWGNGIALPCAAYVMGKSKDVF